MNEQLGLSAEAYTKVRKAIGTQDQVAKLLNSYQSSISARETGTRAINVSQSIIILAALVVKDPVTGAHALQEYFEKISPEAVKEIVG